MAEVQYNTLLTGLLANPPLNELGMGKPCAEMRGRLEQLSPDAIAVTREPRDRSAASGCCAGLWLRYNFLEESHQISQQLEDADGSFWHAIMHRRESDFSNAKYWFRRVGNHPIFGELAPEAARLARAQAADWRIESLLNQSHWDPLAFVDLCEKSIGSGSSVELLCREIQRREWDLLFDFCYRKAVAV
jgi:hypothetical protein